MKIPNFHFSSCSDSTGRVKSLKRICCLVIIIWDFCSLLTMPSFRSKSPRRQSKPGMCVRGNPDFCKKKHSSSGLILYLLSSFLVTSILWSNLKENCLNLLSADIFEMFLRWPNTVFARAFADAIQHVYKVFKKQTCRHRAIILFTQHPHSLCYFYL